MPARPLRVPLVVALGGLFAFGALVPAALRGEDAGAARPDLVPRDYDSVYRKDGSSEFGKITIREDGIEIASLTAPGVTHRYKLGEYDHIELGQTAAVLIKKRVAWDMAHNHPDDIDDAIKAINWGRSWTNKDADAVAAAKESAFAQAQKAMAKWPSNLELGKLMLSLYEEKGDGKSLEELARKLVAVDPHWTPGYEYIAKALQADPARAADLEAFLGEWIKAQPTVFTPNKLLAGINERAGKIRLAKEEYRKCYEFYHDLESGLGYARTALACGEIDHALATAAAPALASGDFADEIKVVAGSAKLIQGDAAGAQAQLQDALKGKLGDESAKLAHYNLGLTYMLGGQPDQAREQWTSLGTPLANLALAILDRKPYVEVEQLPTDGLKELARRLNACVDLEHGTGTVASTLDPAGSKRNLFISLLAKMVINGGAGSATTVKELEATPGIESQRWQVYGLLLARKYKDAEALVATLPADDAYGIAYRVCIAEGLKQPDVAKEWFKKLETASTGPRDWVARVHVLYESASDEAKDEKFNWPDGDIPNDGFQYFAHGTSIHIHALGGHLVFDGTQSASPEPVSSAMRLIRADRFRTARLDLDISGVGTASTGLQVLDDKSQNGVALTVHGDNHLAWRELKNGTWSQWTDLPLQIQGTHATLCLEYNLGRLMAFMADDPLQKHALGDGFDKPSPELYVGVFGTAEPGVTWKLTALELQIQLKQENSPPRRRLGDG